MSIKVAIIGTGYVGLVSGACLAEAGHEVICADKDEHKIELLARGQVPIYEPGLQPLVEKNITAGSLRFTANVAEAVASAEIIVIAVGTPGLPAGDVDMSQVHQAADQIADAMNDYKIIAIKSTVPVGTAKYVEERLRRRIRGRAVVDVVSNPEFLREGSAVHDTFHADRIVIGAANSEAAKRMEKLHAPFQSRLMITDRESAEMIKYASNSFLATKISFINEIANICEKIGADVTEVSKGLGMDHRIGPHYLNAGIGYGGFCLPKDTCAHVKIAEHVDYDFKIMRAVIEVNERQRRLFADKISLALDGDVNGKTIAVLGLTFKPDTDDMRDAPSVDIIRWLQERGAAVRAYDPLAESKAFSGLFDDLFATADPYEALVNADAAAIVTEWATVRHIDWSKAKALLKRPVVVDGRNVLDPEKMARLGFEYISIGRPILALPSML
jgi:UDPglucose 6-dehydrogenase